jgi:uncharacterized DUF497 family protein
MRFDWDAGNIDHVDEHGVTPDEAVEAFFNGLIWIAFQERNREFRRVVVGRTDAGRLLTVVYTLRDQKIRVVTALDASKPRRRLYRDRRGADG